MNIIDTIIGVLAPYDCVSCGQEGRILCSYCAAALPGAREQCYKCYEPSRSGSTCLACRRPGSPDTVYAATAYRGAAKELVWWLKFRGAQSAAKIMANNMSIHPKQGVYTCIVPVPTANHRARVRGFDQAKLLARALSRSSTIPYVPCLGRIGETRQVGMSRKKRLSQLDHAFYVKNPGRISNAAILLVDDVMTTGATLEAATLAVRNAGAVHVSAAVFARA